MNRIISGYHRLFVPNAGIDNNVEKNNMNCLKEKAMTYVEQAFKKETRDEAQFLLQSTKIGTVQANVSLMLLCEESTRGRNLRLKMTTVNGYKSFAAAADIDNFRYLCLVPDVPKVVLDDSLLTEGEKSKKKRSTERSARLQALLKGTLLMTNYIDTSKSDEKEDMNAFRKELNEKQYGSSARIWALNGVSKETTKTSSIFSLHQRVSLLRVVWNYFIVHEKTLPTPGWITDVGYDMINGSNPEHFHYYADIADKHRLAIDEYVRTELKNEHVQSAIKIMQTKGNTIPRQLSVCSWKNFLPKDIIEHFVKTVCNGGVRYLLHNGRYIRMAKSHDFPLPTEFFLSAKRFPCVFTVHGETKLMHHVNGMFALQNPLLEEKEKEAFIELSKTKPVNVMMTAVSKIGDNRCAFGEHNDWSRLNASLRGETIILEDNCPLPQRHLMQVLTIGFTYPIVDEEEACLEFTIEWRYNGITVGKITTTGNFAHLQLYGLNDEFFTHDIQYLFRGVIPDAVRVVITFRRIFSRDPTDKTVYDAKVTEECSSKGAINKPAPDIDQLYKHTNVINTLLGIDSSASKEKDEAAEDDNSNSGSESDSENSKLVAVVKKIPLKFTQLKPEEYKRFCLPRPKPPKAYPESMGASMARSAVVMKLLREDHTLLYRHYGKLQNKPAMWVKKQGSMYKPGEQVDMARVAADSGITYNSHQHSFAPKDPLNDAVFMLSYQPKNDCVGMRQTYDIMQKAMDGKVKEEDVELPTIFTFGSGGNVNKQGTNAPPSLHKASKGDPAVTLQCAQSVSDNECNSTALSFHTHDFLVAVIASDSLLGIDNAKKRGDSGRFMYMYRLAYVIHCQCLEDDKYKAHIAKYGDGCKNEEFSFLQGSCIKIILEPAFPFSEYMKMYRKSEETPLKRLYFPWYTTKEIIASNIPNMVSKDGEMRHRNKVLDAFVTINKKNFEKAVTMQNASSVDIENLDLNGEGMEFIANDMSLKDECYRANAAELVMCCILISAANAYRHVGQSLAWIHRENTSQDTLTAIPLIGRWQHWYLGITNQCIPINPPNRSFDAVVLLQQHIFNKQHKNMFQGRLLNPVVNEEFSPEAKSALFVAIVTRFTGNPSAILHYESYCKEHAQTNNVKTMFLAPSKSSITQFIRFLESTATKSKEVGYVISNKHRQSFYPMMKNKLHIYKRFLTQLSKRFDKYISNLWNMRVKLHKGELRAAAANETKQFLARCIYNNDNLPASFFKKEGKGLSFLSHACLADWEELFKEPVGAITFESVTLGPGGESALELVAHTMKISLKRAADEILRVIKEVIPNKWLLVLGYKKVHNKVCSTTNEREIGYSDVDQTSCKFYTLVISTHPTRTGSETPNADKPHCEPVRVNGDDYDFDAHKSMLSPIAHKRFEDKVRVHEEILSTCVNPDGTENSGHATYVRYVYNTGKADSTTTQEQTLHYHILPEIPQMPGEEEYLNGRTRKTVAEEYLGEWKHEEANIGQIRRIIIPTVEDKEPSAKRQCTRYNTTESSMTRRMTQQRLNRQKKAARTSDEAKQVT